MMTLSLLDHPNYSSAEFEGFELSRADLKPQVGLFRVLSGTCVIRHQMTGDEVSAETNYFASHLTLNTDCSLSFLDDYQEGLCAADYDCELRLAKSFNRKFYSVILAEISVTVFSLERGRYVEAFLHLYRCYERLAYAFPMIYAAKNPDYMASFESLKKWLGNASADQPVGELAFLKKFLLTFDKNLLDQAIDFDIIAPADGAEIGSESQEIIFATITKRLLGWHAPELFASGTASPARVSVPFRKMHEVLLTARNRYFHLSSGRSDNLEQVDIVDAGLFFSILTPPLLSYVAQLFHNVFAHNMATTEQSA